MNSIINIDTEIKGINKNSIKTVNKKDYIIKSIFLGDAELKDLIWKIAETKTIREMGLPI